MKRLLPILFALSVLAGGAFLYSGTEENGAEKIETSVIARGDLEDVVSAQGTLEPKDYVDVGVQVSGQLKKLYVDIGDQVKQGDLLAELDPQFYQSNVNANEAKIKSLDAQISEKKAQAAFDRAQFDRAEKLVKANAISREEYETKEKTLKVSEAALSSLEAQKEQAQADLEADRINLGYTMIFSPMDGVVSDQLAREGQTLNANQTTPTVVQIANLDIMTVRAEIAEADVMRLRIGMESRFSTLGSDGRTWTGIVRQILPTPEVVNDVVLYHALIDVENKDHKLMNGMSTQNSFVIGRAENALLVPVRALGDREPEKDVEDAKAYRIHVATKAGPEPRTVLIGLATRASAEVKAGLSEGERVITSDVPDKTANRNAPRMPGMGRL